MLNNSISVFECLQIQINILNLEGPLSSLIASVESSEYDSTLPDIPFDQISLGSDNQTPQNRNETAGEVNIERNIELLNMINNLERTNSAPARECVVCFESHAGQVILNCGHSCVCFP